MEENMVEERREGKVKVIEVPIFKGVREKCARKIRGGKIRVFFCVECTVGVWRTDARQKPRRSDRPD